MFDTVGRYRDPEATVRRVAAGCLTFVGLGAAFAAILAGWLAVWLLPWIKALLLLLVHALFGRAPSWLEAPVLIAELRVAEVEVDLGEPYLWDDPEPVIPPLPGSEPLAMAALDLPEPAPAEDGPAIAPLRGWNDDDDFALPAPAYLDEELAVGELVMMLGTISSSDGGALENVLSATISDGSWEEEFGSGGLGLSGSGDGGAGVSGFVSGGTAEGVGGLGTRGGGIGGIGFGSAGRGEEELVAELAAVDEYEEIAEIGGVEGGVVGGSISGLYGSGEGGTIGGLIGARGDAFEGFEGFEGLSGLGGLGAAGTEPRILEQAAPDYPEEAREAGLSGVCRAEVQVNKNGRGTLVSLEGCDARFRGAVAKAVERSRWIPATVDGQPIGGTTTARFVFSAE